MDADKLAALGFEFIGGDIWFHWIKCGTCLEDGGIELNKAGQQVFDELTGVEDEPPKRRGRPRKDASPTQME